MTAATLRWMLSMPMEIEAQLESLLGPRTLALPQPARGQAAGDYVATLIEAEVKRQAEMPRLPKPYEAPASTIKRAAKVVEASKTEVVAPRRRGPVAQAVASKKAAPVKKKRPPEPDEED